MTLLPCPFCGEIPVFGISEWKDGRRYFELDLKCCVTMSDSIGLRESRNITEADMTRNLVDSLTAIWNARYDPDDGELSKEEIREKLIADYITVDQTPRVDAAKDPKFGRF